MCVQFIQPKPTVLSGWRQPVSLTFRTGVWHWVISSISRIISHTLIILGLPYMRTLAYCFDSSCQPAGYCGILPTAFKIKNNCVVWAIIGSKSFCNEESQARSRPAMTFKVIEFSAEVVEFLAEKINA